MGIYTGSNNWATNVYQFDETDVVQGGPEGTDNKPLQELADRTVYLKNRLGIISSLDGQVDKPGNNSITAADEGKMIVAFGTGVNTLTIADASTLKHGALIPITSYCNFESVINIVGSNGQQFYDLDGMRNAMYMHHKEHLILIALTDHFKVVHASGNFYCAGEEIKARRELRNTVTLRGQLLLRSKFPRLWEYVSSLSTEITSEYNFLTNGLAYQGFFTTGDGSTNFRVPDERGLFERMADAGRGVDYGRLSTAVGSYEGDEVASHNHGYRDRYYPENLVEFNKQGTYVREYIGNNTMGSNSTDKDNNYVLYIDSTTNYAGGIETRPKNISKLNLIKF